MRKIFYYNWVYISLLLFLFVSCGSSIDLVDNHFKFRDNKTPQDKNILNKIDEYKASNAGGNSVYILCSKEDLYRENVSHYYISKITNLSSIYEFPCSGYFIYNNDIILVYSKKTGYINPVNYPKIFLRKVDAKLNDDWTMLVKNCNDNFFTLDGNVISSHHNHFYIENNVVHLKKYFEFNIAEIGFGDKNFAYTNYVNLDNYRTKYPDNCN